MPICPICDDSGVLSTDSTQPQFCYCAAGKQARREWERQAAAKNETGLTTPASFIDIAQLDQVNASVDAMRASLLGSPVPVEGQPATKHPVVQLLYQVAHPGHEISIPEATQLHDLAKALEVFFGTTALIGRKKNR